MKKQCKLQDFTDYFFRLLSWDVKQYIFGVDICQTTGRHIANDNNLHSHWPCEVKTLCYRWSFKSTVTHG
jgi:hypothetical protein